MPRCRRKPAEKQQQESPPACERSDKLETKEKYYHLEQTRERSHRRHPEEVDRVLFRIVYARTTTGDPKVLDVLPPINNDSYPIPREEVEAAAKSLKKSKSAGVDNIQSELVQAEGEAMIDMLLIVLQ